jgi:hypothetical protein
MSETIGAFTVDAAEGVLRPAVNIIKTSVDPAPPTYDASQAIGVGSPISTVRRFATPALALAEALAYRAVVGFAVSFRGQTCFVADCVPDHRAADDSKGGAGAVVVAEWVLVAPLSWVPV